MVSIKTHSRVKPDGTLDLRVPTGLPESDVEVLIVVQPLTEPGQTDAPEALGWPHGFFEQTFGILKDGPVGRLPQGEPEARDPLT